MWKGPAAEAFNTKVAPLSGELDKLTGSYDKAASALDAYWPKLREAQDQALQALAKARAALQAIGATQTLLAAQDEQVVATAATYNLIVNQPVPAGASPTAEQLQAQQAAQSQAQANYQAAQAQAASTQAQLSSAQQSLTDAQTRCAQAISLAQAAASTCGTQLDAAGQAGIRNPPQSLWGSISSRVTGVGALTFTSLPPDRGPQREINIPRVRGPQKEINVPAPDLGQGKQITVPYPQGPEILITVPAPDLGRKQINVPGPSGPLINSNSGSEATSGKGGDDGQRGEPHLTPSARRQLGRLADQAGKTVAEVIRGRGGGASQIRQLQSGVGQETLGEIAQKAAAGDQEAIKALKMAKQAGTQGKGGK